MAKACPNCGNETLRSHEMATIGYPITVNDAGEFEYTGGHYDVFDDGTVFIDDIDCTECGWTGHLADLATTTEVRCPTTTTQPNGEPHTIIGCGSANVELGDDGIYDCLDCGITFDLRQEAKQ